MISRYYRRVVFSFVRTVKYNICIQKNVLLIFEMDEPYEQNDRNLTIKD
jgi:hypothetical protein